MGIGHGIRSETIFPGNLILLTPRTVSPLWRWEEETHLKCDRRTHDLFLKWHPFDEVIRTFSLHHPFILAIFNPDQQMF